MWIHHIGEIAMGFFVVLILIHFGLHFLFKYQKMKKNKQKQNSEKDSLAHSE